MKHPYSTCSTTYVFNGVSIISLVRVRNVRNYTSDVVIEFPIRFKNDSQISYTLLCHQFVSLDVYNGMICHFSQSLTTPTFLHLISCCDLLPRFTFGLMQFVDGGLSELYLETSISLYRLQRTVD